MVFTGAFPEQGVYWSDLCTPVPPVLASVDQSGSAFTNLCERPIISGDGRYIVFSSLATNVLRGITNYQRHLFARDLLLSQTMILPAGIGALPDGPSFMPVFAGNGRTVAFETFARNLVPESYPDGREDSLSGTPRNGSYGDGLDDEWEISYFGT